VEGLFSDKVQNLNGFTVSLSSKISSIFLFKEVFWFKLFLFNEMHVSHMLHFVVSTGFGNKSRTYINPYKYFG
jgi:hypothetical protein